LENALDHKAAVFAALISLLLICALAIGCGGTKVTVTTEPKQAASSQKTTQPSNAASGVNILKNSDFAEGLSGWDVVDQGGSRAHGVNKVDVVGVEDSAMALHITRTCPENDGGASGVSQELSVTLKPGDRLVLSAKVRADNEVGGALAGSDPRWFPEGPVQFRIFYEAGGKAGEWYHGFYYGDVPGADSANFTRVQQGKWYEYASPDIAGELGAEARITEFRVYGFGWDFDGYAADVALSTS
jgi:hypothetical protein